MSRLKIHAIQGAAATAALYPVIGEHAISFGLATVFIDVDHVFEYDRDTKSCDMRGLFPYCNLIAENLDKNFLVLSAFHTIEFFILMLWLSALYSAPRFAPQVLEQSARRRLSLLTAVRDAALSPRTVEALLAPQTAFPSGAAYRLWISSDLFHAGFRSSLDLYDELRFPRSHFGFDLPPLAEDPPRDDGFKLSEREESVPIGAVSQRLLHAEMPVLPGGGRLGAVVGHVLEDPSNLPFLPGASADLSTLGPGAPRAALDDPSGKPADVLYDASGRVLFSTLDPPPEASTIPLLRAERGEVVQVRAGAETFVAIPLKAPDRLHLLALPARTLLDRLGEFVRLLLVGYASPHAAVPAAPENPT